MRTPTASDSTPQLSLVIPAYNEAKRLEDGFERLRDAANAGALERSCTQCIVIDDGSTDTTATVAHDLLSTFGFFEHFVLRLRSHEGKGRAVKAGMAFARAPVVVMADADMSIFPKQIPLLQQALRTTPIAIGSRRSPASSHGGLRRSRVIAGKAFASLVAHMTDIGVKDSQCGFKGFTTAVAQLLFHFATVKGLGFDVEILSLAKRCGQKVEQVPVDWDPIPNSKISIKRDFYALVKDARAFRRQRRIEGSVLGIALPNDSLTHRVISSLHEACSTFPLNVEVAKGSGMPKIASVVRIATVGDAKIGFVVFPFIDPQPRLDLTLPSRGAIRVEQISFERLLDLGVVDISPVGFS